MPIHSHTTFSLLDGLGNPGRHLDAVKNAGLPGYAMTDHRSSGGWYQFDETFSNAGVNLVKGVEGYFTPDRHEKHKETITAHLVMLAKNETGLKNINRIITRSNAEGFYGYPRCDYEVLKDHHEGVITTSSCVAGMAGRYIERDEPALARDHLVRMQEIFGEDFYLELQPHPFGLQDKVNDFLINFSQPGGDFPYVISNDSHYPFEEDKPHHEVSVCVAIKRTLSDENRMKYEHGFHIKGFDELYEDFSRRGIPNPYIESAIENTKNILIATKVPLPQGLSILPEWPNAEFELKQHLDRGIIRRFNEIDKSRWKEYSDRLRYEFDLIRRKGFCEYFLVVRDVIAAAHSLGVYVAPGRGSVGGSLLAYVLGITEVDPIRWNLSFERFLSPHRNDMPDIDIDFSDKQAIFQYLKNKYGTEHVSYVSNYVRLSGQSTINDVARVMEVSVPKKVREEIKQHKGVKSYIENRYRPQSDEKLEKALQVGANLEGNVRHLNVHAGGVIISKTPISDYSAQYLKEGERVSVYDKDDLEKIGFLKIDVLITTNTAIMHRCMQLVEERGGELPQDIWDLPLDDRRMMEEFSKGNTDLIFQYGGFATKTLLKQMKPDRIEDLVAVNALSRPGPDERAYAMRKLGEEKVTYPHPAAKPFLEETYGVMVYQEQIMDMAREIAGMDWAGVHKVRKMSGKKDRSQVEPLKKEFVEGCMEKSGLPESGATKLWNEIESFAEYGFNKSHCVAYFIIAWANMYLQVYHPFEWILANLEIEESDDKKSLVIAEAMRIGIPFKDIDINYSEVEWSYDDDALVPGLTNIRGLGRSTAAKLVKARNKSPFVNHMERVTNRKQDTKQYYLVQESKKDKMDPGKTLKDGDWRYHIPVPSNAFFALRDCGALPHLEGNPMESKLASNLPVDVTQGKTVHPFYNPQPLSTLSKNVRCVHGYVKSSKKQAKDHALSLQGDVTATLFSQDSVEPGPYIMFANGEYRTVDKLIPMSDWQKHPMDRDFGELKRLDKSVPGVAYLVPARKTPKHNIVLALTPEPKTLFLDKMIPQEGLYVLESYVKEGNPYWKKSWRAKNYAEVDQMVNKEGSVLI